MVGEVMEENVPIYDEQDNPIKDPDLSKGVIAKILEKTGEGDESYRVVKYIYHRYTDEELAFIEADKEKAEKEARLEEFLTNGPTRLDALEDGKLETDEALTAIYETMLQRQLDTDEALTSLYDTMIGGEQK